jgi:hypothetical protein
LLDSLGIFNFDAEPDETLCQVFPPEEIKDEYKEGEVKETMI